MNDKSVTVAEASPSSSGMIKPNGRSLAKKWAQLAVAGARLVSDLVVINVAFVLAWWLRYETGVGPDFSELNYVPIGNYLPMQLGLSALLLFMYAVKGVYRRRTDVSWLDEVGTVASGSLVSVAIAIVVVFYAQQAGLSRLIFVYVLVFTVVLISVARWLERITRAQLRKRGVGVERVLVVGAGSLGRIILQNSVARPDLGLQVVGFVDDEREEDLGRFRALGKVADIRRLIREEDLDQVIVALPGARHREIAAVLMHCERAGVKFRVVPDFFEFSLRQIDIVSLSGVPLIGLKEPAFGRWALATKRVVDITVSFLVLSLASPLLLAVALAIKLDSQGPVIFRQERLGRGGKPFVAFKFRSMRAGAEEELDKLRRSNEADGAIFKMREDPRVTRVGRFVRRTSLDEVPQLLNVLRGEMSLVGPRPPIPAEVENYEEWHGQRLEAPPGLTGLWQVSGRSDLTFDEMVLLDLWYIENWSLGLDFKILLQTVPAVLTGSGAY